MQLFRQKTTFDPADLSQVRAVREPLRASRGAARTRRGAARARRGVFGPTRVMVAAAGAVALAALLGVSHGSDGVQTVQPVSGPHWAAANPTDQWFSLQASAVADLPHTYVVKREAGDESREDILTFGKPEGEAAYVHLAIRRTERGGPESSLFVALVRRAAEAGLAVTHASQPFFLPTRLGAFESAEVTLSADARERSCLGFRLSSTDSRLRILGLACAAGGKPFESAATACLVDWLDLSARTYDPVLKNFFAEADRRRGSACASPRSITDVLQVSDAAPARPEPAPAGRRHAKKRAGALL